MKKIIPLALMLIIIVMACESKKKQFIPLQSIIQQSASPTTTGIGTNSSSSASTTTVTVPSAGSNTSSLNEVQPGASVTVNTNNSDPFTYETTTTIPVDLVVTDNQGNPVSPATVTITDSANDSVLLQQVTSPSGSVVGTITVPTTSTQVDITVTAGGSTSQPVSVPLQVPVTNNGTTTNQPISSIGNIALPIPNPAGNGTQIADRDGDGIDDAHDAYPDDPKKATKVRFPSTGVNTIAFEDLYPNAGDADLNDYVVQFYNEEDLNAQGQIVEIRGAYQHVARGAGYRHTLNLKFLADAKCKTDVSCSANAIATYGLSFESTITNSLGVNQNTGLAKFTPTASQIDAGLSILGNSGNTISSPNAALNQTYAAGHVSKIKITFANPIPRTVLGPAPYNIYLHVNNTNKDIYFPGKYFDDNGKDLYMDSNGFPWAIMVPGVWAWPLESKDIRNANVTGYPRFNTWATSKGTTDKDWYTTVVSGKVYPIPAEPSNLLAYLKVGESANILMSIALIAFGISMGLVIRKKLSSV